MRKFKNDPNIRKEDIKKESIFILSMFILLLLYFIGWAIIYTIYDALVIMGIAFFILVPSFLTNGAMVLAGKIKGIKRYPMDGGRLFKDGKRILGEGKTWNGFLGGWLIGFVCSSLINWWFFNRISDATYYELLQFVDEEFINSFFNYVFNQDGSLNYRNYLLSQFIIAFGSPVGDSIGSFFKRRTKHARGSPFLFWDQNDFIIVSALFACLFFPLNWYYWIFLVLITPFLTAIANWIGFLMNKKDVPW